MLADKEASFFSVGDTVYWLKVDNILVRVMRTDEGALCDMYDAARIEEDMDGSHLAACYAFFNEAQEVSNDR